VSIPQKIQSEVHMRASISGDHYVLECLICNKVIFDQNLLAMSAEFGSMSMLEIAAREHRAHVIDNPPSSEAQP
jgi:hypothetical protein